MLNRKELSERLSKVFEETETLRKEIAEDTGIELKQIARMDKAKVLIGKVCRDIKRIGG